jgi:hypothetical protein
MYCAIAPLPLMVSVLSLSVAVTSASFGEPQLHVCALAAPVPISTATTAHSSLLPIVLNALGVAFLLFGAAGCPLFMLVFMMFEKLKMKK